MKEITTNEFIKKYDENILESEDVKKVFFLEVEDIDNIEYVEEISSDNQIIKIEDRYFIILRFFTVLNTATMYKAFEIVWRDKKI